jgi:hypothetical protein
MKMISPVDAPHVRAGGLVTVAFLKASLDEGNDHLGIFMPLVLDVLSRLPSQTFATADIQEALAADHGVAMPQQVVATLLKRAAGKKYLIREAARYRRVPSRALPPSNVLAEKTKIEEGQRNLAEALRRHAQKRDLAIESTEIALDMLFRFLEAEQVGLLLQGTSIPETKVSASHRERAIVADFIQNAIQDDLALLHVLRGMLEGLVLYHAAFLPDLSAAGCHFNKLRVIFDSNLVRQALGYEGIAMSTLMRETVNVLKGSSVQCLVFDKTLHEIQRILSMYEARLATEQGRAMLRQVPMARHFLTSRYSASDVREMSALLEQEVVALGFQIIRAPKHIPEFTSAESLLAKRLSDPTKKDELEPRVVHDVDCVAGVLTLRRGHRSMTLEDAQVVFATNSPLVIRNAKLWWEQDEHESGIEPVVHIRALTNLAWLKKPSLCSDFKVRELVALCTAALRPDQKTWERFLQHLRGLEKSNKVSSDEVTTILVSAMSDQLLAEAALGDDADDIDATTLDEIVDRVTTAYADEALKRIDVVRSEYEQKMREVQAGAHAATERADAVASTAAAEIRRRDVAIEGRARAWAGSLTLSVKIFAFVILAVGCLVLITERPIQNGWTDIALAVAIGVFIVLEFFGILKHVSKSVSGLKPISRGVSAIG